MIQPSTNAAAKIKSDWPNGKIAAGMGQPEEQ